MIPDLHALKFDADDLLVLQTVEQILGYPYELYVDSLGSR